MSESPAEVQIRLVDWGDRAETLLSIRHEVFVQGQNVPEEIERDGKDPDCFHAIAFENEKIPVGVARMNNAGHMGRVAVLAGWRGRGIGTGLVRFLIELARTMNLTRVDVNSQIDARGFYQRLGFVSRDETFEEAGIEHVNMVLGLRD